MRNLKVWLFAIAAALTSLTGTAHAAYNYFSPYWATSNLGPAQAPVNGLKYFGYPMVVSVGSSTPDFTLIPEMKNHTNAVAAIYEPTNPTGLAPLLGQLAADFKLIIFVDKIFFKPDNSRYTTAEISANLSAFQAVYGSHASKIAYLGFDEPLYRFQQYYCATAPSGCPGGVFGTAHPSVNADGIYNYLEKWMSQVRSTIPGPGVMHIEAGFMVQPDQWLPVNADVYGFDCYVPWGGTNCNGMSIADRWSLLKTKVNELNTSLSGYRRLAVIPQVNKNYSRTDPAAVPYNRATADSDALTLYNNYKTLWKPGGVADPMVNLVGPWIWADLDDGQGGVSSGVRGLPNTRNQLHADGWAVRVAMGQSSGSFSFTWTSAPLMQFLYSANTVHGSGASNKGIWVWSATGANVNGCHSITEPASFPSMPTSGAIIIQEPSARSLMYTIECTGPYGSTQKTVSIVVQ